MLPGVRWDSGSPNISIIYFDRRLDQRPSNSVNFPEPASYSNHDPDDTKIMHRNGGVNLPAVRCI